MPVPVTSNFDDDPIKNERAIMETGFSHYKSMGNFLDTQEQHPRSLISAFVVRCLDSIIPQISISEISSLLVYLASVAEQAGLSLTWSKNPRTGFS